MAISIRPYADGDIPAAKAFNERMLHGKAPSEFMLPEATPRPLSELADPLITSTYFLAADGEFVRGGFVLTDYPASLAGEKVNATDLIAPLSEGIIDPAFGMTGMQYIKYLQKYTKYGMAVGMGNVNNPFPRLLKAAGWNVMSVPFFFHVVRAGRFFSQMRVFEGSTIKKLVAKIAGPTGLGTLGLAALQYRKWTAGAALDVADPGAWGAWADEIWSRFVPNCSFAITRDAAALREFHPAADKRMVRLVLKRDGKPVGWAAALLTRMHDDKYFGNLKVATIMDCVAAVEDLPAAIVASTNELGRRGADLVITNQTHTLCQNAFRAAGYLSGPSNYCLGVSKTITEAVKNAGGDGTIYVTRADGDGRMHL